ncbi:hypothetical protein KLP28_06415 [Nocardioidaceae bacterium]|nr:hypothetical protein KLP28_06415 [Nocardioidaceae bacterium]
MTDPGSPHRPRCRVVVHVGAPKTGTTYLQERLAANAARLAAHGVTYPVLDGGDHFSAALDLIDMDWGGQREQVRGSWDELVADVAAAPDGATVIVSHELLAGASKAQVRQAVAQLEAAGCTGEETNEVHVVYAARDLARQIPAEWQEGVKHRRKRSFAKFTTVIGSARKGPGAKIWFWRAQDVRGVLTRWGVAVPTERLHLVTVPRSGAGPDELFHRYCTAMGIDPSWAPEPAGGANTSIGTAETAMLRRLNKRLKAVDFRNEAYRVLVRQLVVHETLAQRPGSDKAAIDATVHSWAAPLAEEWIGWVQEQGIPVVGDLDELRVPAPRPGERTRPVDKPKQGDVADAAMDALVAVLQRAAQHDPQARPVSHPRAAALARRVARRSKRALRRVQGTPTPGEGP